MVFLRNDTDTMTNDYFDTLLDMSVQWKPNGTGNSYEAFDRLTGNKVRTATRSDLSFWIKFSIKSTCRGLCIQ